MKHLKKVGGIAALYEAVAYVVGIVVFLLVLDYSGVVEPAQKLTLLVDNHAILYMMNLFVYVVFGIFLVVLALALHERLKTSSPAIAEIATALGLIWAGLVMASGMVANIGAGVVVDLYGRDPAQAASVWLAIDSVVEGIGGGNEIIGGLWTLLVSWAALRTRTLPRALNYIGIVVGAAGILSAVPSLGEAGGMVFGFGQIVWFVWLGVVLLRSHTSAAAQ
jgi:hypothetical protein